MRTVTTSLSFLRCRKPAPPTISTPRGGWTAIAGRCVGIWLLMLLIGCSGVQIERANSQNVAPRRPSAISAVVSWKFEIEADPQTERFLFTTTLPRSISNRQYVNQLRITPEPTRRWVEAGTEYAQFDIDSPPLSTSIIIDADLQLFRADLMTLRGQPTTRPAGDLSPWLGPETMIESDDPAVRQLANSLPPGSGLHVIRDIFKATLVRLQRANYMPEDHGAAWTLAHRRGDCSEYSDLFVALCRARGIPAFVTEGYVITRVNRGDTPRHAWAEAYVDGIGWVPFDPFHAAGGSATFEELSPTRIIHSVRRSDPNLDNYHHWAYRFWGRPIVVRDTFTVHKAVAIETSPATQQAVAR